MTRTSTLLVLLVLAGCTAAPDEPEVPRTWLVWQDNNGVFALDGDKPHRLGSYQVGGVAIAPDGTTGAAVLSDDSLGTDAELVVWSPNGTERRVPCGACKGAVIAGDEVRTADVEGDYIRRFNRWDGSFLGTVLAPPPRLEHEPVVAPREVIAATAEVTVLRYTAAELPDSDALYAIGVEGSVRWERVLDLPAAQFVVDPTGTTLAFTARTGDASCGGMRSRPVLLDLDSGRLLPSTDPPVDPDLAGLIVDLSWNGPNLVAVTTVIARTDTTCAEDRPNTIAERRGDQWDRAVDSMVHQHHTLPGGRQVRVTSPMLDLEITDGRTTRALAGDAIVLANLPSRTAASLEWPA
ncbi:hypothetical protein [Actinokineospora terrae]|uniref:Lipoprotein n=1 Tax=Actinokineospora terrae TaxID=155974 RepID=A0A1H9MVG2_9PSEU|nr:hypothetical protein [Actinokineospora terrae]SER27093.1 hypothetical protein SAMN04487818_102331 [Actinokineospora terrae]